MRLAHCLPLLCVVLLTATFACDHGPRLGRAERGRLQAQAEVIRVALESYYAQHARYPASLPQAGLSPAAVQTPFGTWQYAPDSLGRSYSLRLSDHGRHGLILTWDARRQDWSWGP